MTSPSCDCAYSVMPTVPVSPSVLTHSWLWLNRIPLRSGMASPFVSFRTRPLVKGQRDDFGRCRDAANIHAQSSSLVRQGRWHVGHRDVVAQGEGDVARG